MIRILVLCLLLATSHLAIADQWQPKDARLLTRWAADIDPQNVHSEYPRPQLERGDWQNLNGRWEYAIVPKDAKTPDKFDGKILVPFCVESALSGVSRNVGAEQALWYRREIAIPAHRADKRILLHFGAVDWETTVWINGQQVGQHRGGYDPFSFDITDQVDGGSAEVLIRVWDPTDNGSQPCGKQRNEPEGIWYTPVTGIWQTVWLEFVPKRGHIESLKIIPDIENGNVSVDVITEPIDAALKLAVTVDGLSMRGRRIKLNAIDANRIDANKFVCKLPNPNLWSPKEPWIYHLTATISDATGKEIDRVTSYFGMRKVAIAPDQNGVNRIELNGEPLFQFGPLDQGWWPDGLYTAASDEAMRYDLELTQQLGFNMVRKHVKVEPHRWYHYCDVMGLLVWQDLPNGGKHAPWPRDGVEIERDAESAAQMESELKALIDEHYNVPSIVMWVPFNEAWGQYDTVRIANWVQQYDSSRLVNAASGGNDFLAGDVDDDHFYPGPGASPALPDRAVVLGEYGGLGLPIKGHTWQDEKNWGYRSFDDSEKLTNAYVELIDKLRPLVESHVSAAVYTQTTDVEVEVNGLLTYDREIIKLDQQKVAAANAKLFQPLPKLNDRAKANLSTLAWWRFESGAVGQPTPNTQQHPKQRAARDVSGHNNHLYAFGPPQSPHYSDDVPDGQLVNGEPNRVCLDDSQSPGDGIPTMDLFTDPGRSRTHMDVINTFQFRHWTIEFSFKIAQSNHFHCFIGKDGRPTDAPQAPLQFKVRGDDNQLQIEAIDSEGNVREARSGIKIESGKWYHTAAVSDGNKLKLYLDSGEGYELVSETAFSGPLINSMGTWSVGRGFYDGKIADDARGWIDEIRVSASARKPTELLFAP